MSGPIDTNEIVEKERCKRVGPGIYINAIIEWAHGSIYIDSSLLAGGPMGQDILIPRSERVGPWVGIY
jgi:hypothetical protein